MPNARHLEVLEQGVRVWNQWREENPQIDPDLSSADLSSLNLFWAKLNQVDLVGANLSRADLYQATLTQAYLRYANLLRADLSGADLRSADLTQANLTCAELRGANLRWANLSGTELGWADLSDADLSGAVLSHARLGEANLTRANLNSSHLEYANLMGAILQHSDLGLAHLAWANLVDSILKGADLNRSDLNGADLRGADLSGADLSFSTLTLANLSDANLSGADLSRSDMSQTVLNNNDLNSAIGLDTVKHKGPSTLGFNTLRLSKGSIPEVFLRGCGLNNWEIEMVRLYRRDQSSNDFTELLYKIVELRSDPLIQFYSCFISYSHADKPFARRLHDALQRRGIRCWLDEHQVLPGDDIYEQVARGIRLWDKVLLCCSENSLKSWWVDDEIARAFDKEQTLMRERGQKVLALIPLNLDGYMFGGEWESGKATQIKSRLAADFTGWETDDSKFKEQFKQLVLALRADAGGRKIPPPPKL